MKRILLVLAAMLALSMSASAQLPPCYYCEEVVGLNELRCAEVHSGIEGTVICYPEPGGVCAQELPSCFSCGGDCESKLLRDVPRVRYASFRQERATVRLNLDADTIRALARKSPELAYAVARVAGSDRPLVEGQGRKLTWLRFRIDPAHAQLWLDPKSDEARSYFAIVAAEGSANARVDRANARVEVYVELNGAELTVVAMAGVPQNRLRFLKITLTEGQIVRGGGGARI